MASWSFSALRTSAFYAGNVNLPGNQNQPYNQRQQQSGRERNHGLMTGYKLAHQVTKRAFARPDRQSSQIIPNITREFFRRSVSLAWLLAHRLENNVVEIAGDCFQSCCRARYRSRGGRGTRFLRLTLAHQPGNFLRRFV